MRGSIIACLLLLAGCAGPPPSAYVGGASRSAAGGLNLGRNTAGEPCTQQGSAMEVDLFCGTWDQPSGHVAQVEGSDPQTVALSSRWRNALDGRFDCSAPAATTILGNAPALVMNCTRRVGGWPQEALVANVDGRLFVADGILPALPVMERAIGVLSGRVTAEAAPNLPPGRVDSLLAARLAAQSFGAGDIGQYQALMVAGTRANLAEAFVPAERAYRAAYALQQKTLGRDDPNTGIPLMLIALQMSNQGRSAEADDAFARADRLVVRAADPTALARLRHYQGLNAVNENKPDQGLGLLRTAEAGYAATLPADMLAARPAPLQGPLVTARRTQEPDAPPEAALLEPGQQAALIGVVETRRYQAIVLRQLGRLAEARSAIRSADQLAASQGLRQRDLTARLSRTAALVDDTSESGTGYGGMRRASRDFAEAQPGTRPLAQTELLRAAQEVRDGATADAMALCRRAATLLRELKTGTDASLVAPCLAAFAAEASRHPDQRQALLGEMFAASQLVQGGVTVQQIAQASARLSETAKDPRVGEAIRRQQDASLAVAEAQRRADAQAAAPRAEAATAEELAKQLAQAQATLSDADAALQAAAPNYGQLVQEVVSARDVLAALAPGEAFVSMSLDAGSGWVFLLRDGTVDAVPTRVGLTEATSLVKRLRATIEPTGSAPPAFDIPAAQALFAGTLGQLGTRLDGAASLTVAPVGPLLSLPFEVLLTGPASQDNLGAAPWLMQRYAIAHVPAPANFVTLRRAADTARANRPWFGFGDFIPVTVGQAERSFPANSCEDSAKLFAGLAPLPFARRELLAARLLLGGAPGDALEGRAFTTQAVLRQDLRGFRVLHFATHALLPSDLRCQTEAAIVTSAPGGAANANGALLTASDITAMQLDAEVVILSACNSGGPGGTTSGESLSGLARAFFYAGARSLMVTHWSVNDQATALLVAGTLKRLGAGDPLGVAGALRGAQQGMLAEAGKGLPAAVAHPFFWAPFALVGDGRGRIVSAGAGPARRLAGL